LKREAKGDFRLYPPGKIPLRNENGLEEERMTMAGKDIQGCINAETNKLELHLNRYNSNL
jgi:hypothetical protein